MICDKCGSVLIVKNNPKYKPPYEQGETHLIYECLKCKPIN
jgi:RNase P subunit RPR2